MDNQSPNQSEKKKNQSHVRFTDDEFTRITQEAKWMGLSIPRLLKRVYFEKKALRILMEKEDQKTWARELLRVGNNVNQIAKHLNAGIASPTQEDLKSINRTLTGILTAVIRPAYTP